mmetsp:Transcript_82270/g.172244  ORF Transcript_82270/g.172244 Transcript_82270/m.172244 type:complete len:347 (+) Transcript_82270:756-1796(+)
MPLWPGDLLDTVAAAPSTPGTAATFSCSVDFAIVPELEGGGEDREEVGKESPTAAAAAAAAELMAENAEADEDFFCGCAEAAGAAGAEEAAFEDLGLVAAIASASSRSSNSSGDKPRRRSTAEPSPPPPLAAGDFVGLGRAAARSPEEAAPALAFCTASTAASSTGLAASSGPMPIPSSGAADSPSPPSRSLGPLPRGNGNAPASTGVMGASSMVALLAVVSSKASSTPGTKITCILRLTRIWPFALKQDFSAKMFPARARVPTQESTTSSGATNSGVKGLFKRNATLCCWSHCLAYCLASSPSCGSTSIDPSTKVIRNRGRKWTSSAAISTPTRPAPTMTAPRAR